MTIAPTSPTILREQAEHVEVQRRLRGLLSADDHLQPCRGQDPESPGKPQEDEQRSGGVDRFREQARQIDLQNKGPEPEQHRDAGERAQHVPPELVEPAPPAPDTISRCHQINATIAGSVIIETRENLPDRRPENRVPERVRHCREQSDRDQRPGQFSEGGGPALDRKRGLERAIGKRPVKSRGRLDRSRAEQELTGARTTVDPDDPEGCVGNRVGGRPVSAKIGDIRHVVEVWKRNTAEYVEQVASGLGADHAARRRRNLRQVDQ